MGTQFSCPYIGVFSATSDAFRCPTWTPADGPEGHNVSMGPGSYLSHPCVNLGHPRAAIRNGTGRFCLLG